jgi:hypothetical protein
MTRIPALLLLVLVCLAGLTARAESVVTIDRGRIVLRDVASGAPESLAMLDLGPAPPPGSSRLLPKSEVLRRLREVGVERADFQVQQVVRVASAVRRVPREELDAMVAPELRRRLRPGVELTELKVREGIDLSPRAALAAVRIPEIPKREGAFRTTIIAEFTAEGAPVKQLAIPVVVTVSERGAQPDLQRGARITLVIERGPATVGAEAILLEDADVGDTVQLKVRATSKVLRARIASREKAEVVER